mmetsp:Transcript_42910/g.80552  ORF Transcript_42910/g.80552 Transcript_42910/m.80552 type:complete len:94 (+) Transcript_42910:64-345(+)
MHAAMVKFCRSLVQIKKGLHNKLRCGKRQTIRWTLADFKNCLRIPRESSSTALKAGRPLQNRCAQSLHDLSLLEAPAAVPKIAMNSPLLRVLV